VRCGALLASSFFFVAATAHAAPRVELHWRAAEGCLDEATLAATVERTLDQPVFHGRNAIAATLEGDVAPSDAGYDAKIVLRGVDGAVLAEREIGTTSHDCSRLDDSLAVVVAMMVDGVREKPPAPLRVPPKPPRVVRPPVVGEIEAGAAVAIGLLPDASPGAYVRARVGFARRFSVSLGGYGWSPSDAIELGSGAHIWAWTGELDACGSVLGSNRVTLGVCLALGAGFTDATPIALQGGSETKLPFVYDGVAVDFSVHVAGPLWFHSRAAIWNPFVVPTYFFYGSDGARHDLPSPWLVEPVFSIGLSARFGS